MARVFVKNDAIENITNLFRFYEASQHQTFDRSFRIIQQIGKAIVPPWDTTQIIKSNPNNTTLLRLFCQSSGPYRHAWSAFTLELRQFIMKMVHDSWVIMKQTHPGRMETRHQCYEEAREFLGYLDIRDGNTLHCETRFMENQKYTVSCYHLCVPSVMVTRENGIKERVTNHSLFLYVPTNTVNSKIVCSPMREVDLVIDILYNDITGNTNINVRAELVFKPHSHSWVDMITSKNFSAFRL